MDLKSAARRLYSVLAVLPKLLCLLAILALLPAAAGNRGGIPVSVKADSGGSPALEAPAAGSPAPATVPAASPAPAPVQTATPALLPSFSPAPVAPSAIPAHTPANTARARAPKQPAAAKPALFLRVYKGSQCVTALRVQDGVETAVRVMICSTGRTPGMTPDGTFKISSKYTWRQLYGWKGQYCTRFNGSILFHSVPIDNAARTWAAGKSRMKLAYYNNLGRMDSDGCVRLLVRDAKWIYDSCPAGTRVEVVSGTSPYGSGSKPSLLSGPPYTSADGLFGWDPTDPDPKNPYRNNPVSTPPASPTPDPSGSPAPSASPTVSPVPTEQPAHTVSPEPSPPALRGEARAGKLTCFAPNHDQRMNSHCMRSYRLRTARSGVAARVR